MGDLIMEFGKVIVMSPLFNYGNNTIRVDKVTGLKIKLYE